VEQLKCIGCKKTLKKEYVVLNGGALLVGTTTKFIGKNLRGFLSINNHFKNNYRSFLLAHDCPNGQFKFYACSHKCLADFMHKSIMHLNKFDKIKKVEIAPDDKLEKIGYEWVDKVVQIMGFKGALVTNESTVEDFCCDFGYQEYQEQEDLFLKKLEKKFDFQVKIKDFIWQIAKKYKSKSKEIL
jgi:hypothetical protein